MNRKIAAYEVVIDDYKCALSEDIKFFSEKGYELYGNPYELCSSTAQAMVKYDNITENILSSKKSTEQIIILAQNYLEGVILYCCSDFSQREHELMKEFILKSYMNGYLDCQGGFSRG